MSAQAWAGEVEMRRLGTDHAYSDRFKGAAATGVSRALLSSLRLGRRFAAELCNLVGNIPYHDLRVFKLFMLIPHRSIIVQNFCHAVPDDEDDDDGHDDDHDDEMRRQ
ncbi:hypothetical protein T265_11889 [Opisthorchis viverrini]|uniref:Uncharacterized protein n=1 Tax=Opisthorchis viverrini TaxID=6198 RepID=A0A074YWV8_OPIVI|nr:hypothetical protein T265_11889 [Opisthorchis viverrini]KER19286.1 hypothetical protein T265_11889 [Opisthorchis viverrini]